MTSFTPDPHRRNIIIKPFGENGFSQFDPESKGHLDLQFDGKDYAPQGPGTTPGDTMSAKRIDSHTIQETFKSKGEVTLTVEMTVSQDGKTLTMTGYRKGQQKPIVVGYEKVM